MKICQPRADPLWRGQRWIRCNALRLLIRIIAQDKAQQQSRHNHIAEAEHREMPSIVNAGKYQFSRQIQLGCVPHNAAQIQFARHNSNWIIGGSCGHLDHHICAEYVR